jgi:hypothetical protein
MDMHGQELSQASEHLEVIGMSECSLSRSQTSTCTQTVHEFYSIEASVFEPVEANNTAVLNIEQLGIFPWENPRITENSLLFSPRMLIQVAQYSARLR